MSRVRITGCPAIQVFLFLLLCMTAGCSSADQDETDDFGDSDGTEALFPDGDNDSSWPLWPPTDQDQITTDGDSELGSDSEEPEIPTSCPETCPSGQICDETQGICVDGCHDHEDCPALYRCDNQRKACYFVGCSSDLECSQNLICQRSSGLCVECGEDIDCEGGICNRENMSCVATTCQDDGYEPNDSHREATPIANGRLDKLVLCNPDQDWFVFQAAAGDQAEIDVFTNKQISLSIRHSEITTPLFSGTGQGDPWHIDLSQCTWGGDYWIQVTAQDYQETLSYSLQFDLEHTTSSCRDDSLEENDSLIRARMVEAIAYENLILCPGDPDWYKLALNQGESLEIEVSSNSDTSIGFSVFSPEHAIITEGISGNPVSIPELAKSGSYYIRLLGETAETQATYGLSLTRTLNEPTCTDDPFEENDTPEQAMALATNQAATFSLCPGDDDWFSILVDSGDQLSVTFEASSDQAELVLLSENGTTTLARGVTAEGNKWIAEYTATRSMKLFIRTSTISEGEGFSYELTAALTHAPVCTDDSLENDDTPSEATPIESGFLETLTLCSGDQDWFRFDAHYQDELTIDLLFTHQNGDLDLYLYDPDGYLLAMSTGTSDDEQITSASLALTGIYYILVTGWEEASNHYLLALTITQSSPPCSNDDLEPNDQPTQAWQSIAPFDEQLQLCLDERDWFSFSLNAGEQLDALVLEESTADTLNLDIFDTSGETVLAMGATSDNGTTVTLPAVTMAKRVLLRVQSPQSQAAIAYDLLVDITQTGPTCTDDEYEDNDDIYSSVDTMEGEVTGIICSNDEDWFAVPVAAGGALYAALDFIHSVGDLDLYLYDPYGSLLMSSLSETNREEVFLDESDEDDYFYLRVKGYQDAAGDYILTLLADHP